MSKAKEEFQVVVVQSVICTAVVKVIAGSDEEARELARKEIGHLKPEDFRLEGGEQLQQPFAIEAVATSDLETGREDVRDLVMKDVRFTSMWADVSVGEGCLHAQPWLMEKSSTIRQAADHHAANLRPVLDALAQQGITSLGAVAVTLNERGMLTPRGGRWHKSSVRNLLTRVGIAR